MIKIAVVLTLIVVSFSLSAQTSLKNQFSIELDPAPYILKGYSVSLKFSPKRTPRIAYMASIYQSNFPDGLMSKSNREKGWTNLKLSTSYAAFMEFYLTDERRGVHFGPSLFLYTKSVMLKSTGERTNFSSLYPSFRLGYSWYPFQKTTIYVNPWLNVGSEINIDDKNRLNDIVFKSNTFNYIVALHIGYRF